MPGPEGAPVQQCTGATRLELLELAQCVQQVPLVPDQGPAEQQLAAAGLHPSLHDRARSSAAAIEGAGAIAIPVRARLEEPEAIDALFAALDAELDSRTGTAEFDILVNNAGEAAGARWRARHPRRSTA